MRSDNRKPACKIILKAFLFVSNDNKQEQKCNCRWHLFGVFKTPFLPCLSLSFSHPRTHTSTQPHTHIHKRTLTHTFSRSHSHSPIYWLTSEFWLWQHMSYSNEAYWLSIQSLSHSLYPLFLRSITFMPIIQYCPFTFFVYFVLLVLSFYFTYLLSLKAACFLSLPQTYLLSLVWTLQTLLIERE